MFFQLQDLAAGNKDGKLDSMWKRLVRIVDRNTDFIERNDNLFLNSILLN